MEAGIFQLPDIANSGEFVKRGRAALWWYSWLRWLYGFSICVVCRIVLFGGGMARGVKVSIGTLLAWICYV